MPFILFVFTSLECVVTDPREIRVGEMRCAGWCQYFADNRCSSRTIALERACDAVDVTLMATFHYVVVYKHD